MSVCGWRSPILPRPRRSSPRGDDRLQRDPVLAREGLLWRRRRHHLAPSQLAPSAGSPFRVRCAPACTPLMTPPTSQRALHRIDLTVGGTHLHTLQSVGCEGHFHSCARTHEFVKLLLKLLVLLGGRCEKGRETTRSRRRCEQGQTDLELYRLAVDAIFAA